VRLIEPKVEDEQSVFELANSGWPVLLRLKNARRVVSREQSEFRIVGVNRTSRLERGLLEPGIRSLGQVFVETTLDEVMEFDHLSLSDGTCQL